MKPWNLGFISDSDLLTHVKETVSKYKFTIDLGSFNSNLIDPIKLTFDAAVYGKGLDEMIEAEIIRQIDKSNGTHIGFFHQNIFKFIDGWEVPRHGFDVISPERHIFVELKNKHNTMNAASSKSTYILMQNKILEDDKAICMLVEVITRNSQKKNWVCSINGQRMSHRNILRVSIDRFYEEVTGDPEAFKNLCQVLPEAIKEATRELNKNAIVSTVHQELKKISPNILNSLYLLAFKNYEGFTSFQIG